MSIQITTAKQKVEFSKMVKDYKIRYYNLGPNLLYVDYVDSTGTKTEIVPAYGSFTVISNAGNAANSYLNFYTSSGTTNIVVSKIQQDCAVDGTNLFGNIVTEIDPADITALQSAVSALNTKTANMTASSGSTNFSGATNLTNAIVSGMLLANGGFQADAGTKFWTINESGLVERSGENGLIHMLNGQITCESISPKTVNATSISVGSVNLTESSLKGTESDISNLQSSVSTLNTKTSNLTASTGVSTFSGTLNAANFVASGSVSAGNGLDVDGVATLNDGFTYNDGTNTWLLNGTGLSESGSSGELFSVMSGNIECQKLTAANQINIPNVVSFASAGNNLFGKLNMSVKSDDSDVVSWYLDASEGIKFVEGQGGTGLQIGASGISMPSCFSLMLGTETSGGGVVFYGPERIRLEGGVLFGPRTGLSSIDADGNAAFANCTANTLSALGKVSGNVFEGTASGYDYFEISPGVCKLPSGNPASGTYGYNHWVGTQSDYDRIAEKNINTLYYVIQADNSVNIIKGA